MQKQKISLNKNECLSRSTTDILYMHRCLCISKLQVDILIHRVNSINLIQPISTSVHYCGHSVSSRHRNHGIRFHDEYILIYLRK